MTLAGGIIFTGAMAANLFPAIQVGFGLILFGIGETINHPFRQGFGFGGTITGYPRSNSLLGLAFDAMGIVFLLYGSWRLLLL